MKRDIPCRFVNGNVQKDWRKKVTTESLGVGLGKKEAFPNPFALEESKYRSKSAARRDGDQ